MIIETRSGDMHRKVREKRVGLGGRLAEALGARHFEVEDLKAETLVGIVRDGVLG